MNDIKDTELFLTEYMLKFCTDSGYLSGTLLNSADIDGKWNELAPELCADAVREFNGYPEFCLACAGFTGMAVSYLWDMDWARYNGKDYGFFRGPEGFDTMDEHILRKVMNMPEGSRKEQDCMKAMLSCSDGMKRLMFGSSIERGSADAYRLFLAAMKVMYRIGAAMELHKLGYKFEKLNA